jgi:urease accessory protein
MRGNALNHRTLLVASLVLASGPALAHSFDAQGAGFAAGFGHPLLGLDHLLAMIAVGLWASQLGGRAVWQVPAAFVAALTLGALLAVTSLGLPAVEPGIMASMLVVGLLIAFAVRLPTTAGMAIVALFALCHGHAHGAEMPVAAQPVLYGLGFVLASALLHGLGVGLGLTAARLAAPRLTRAAGAAVALAGAWALVVA